MNNLEQQLNMNQTIVLLDIVQLIVREHVRIQYVLCECRIYALQEAGYAYSSVEGLLTATGKRPLASLLGRSLASVLHEQGIGDR